jgi:hypothetical protein
MPTITPPFHYGVVGAFQQEFLRKAFKISQKFLCKINRKINIQMPKSFIKIKPVSNKSENHNFREVEPNYLIHGSRDNDHEAELSIAEVRKDIEKRYIVNVGQKMQEKATPIREAVVILPDDNNEKNMSNLIELSERLNQNYNIKTFQIHIHNDEGHRKKDDEIIEIEKRNRALGRETEEKEKYNYNYHAHMVMNWTDEKGKSLKLDKKDMSDIQTLTAHYLGMERGEMGSKMKSLNHREYRGFMEIRDKLEKEFKQELSQEQQYKIRNEIINKRENGPRKI